MNKRPSVWDDVRGRWQHLLPRLGVPESFLTGKHGPCPICGGKDRFRFDDKDGFGTWICNQCGAGGPLKLLELLFGWGPAEIAQRIEDLTTGGLSLLSLPRTVRSATGTTIEQWKVMQRKWNGAHLAGPGGPVWRYLRARGIDYSRLIAVREYSLGDTFEMLAVVQTVSGAPCQVHRTVIDRHGTALPRAGVGGAQCRAAQDIRAAARVPRDIDLCRP